MKTTDISKGILWKNLIKLMIPLLFTELILQTYSIADGIFIGHALGTEALSAVANCTPLMFAVRSIPWAFCMATGILVGKCFGAKDEEGTKKFMAGGLAGCFLTVVLVLTVLFSILPNLFGWMGTPPEAVPLAQRYTFLVAIAYAFSQLSNVFFFGMNAVGNTVMPLVFQGIGGILNIGLDALFLYAFDWGIDAVAWATLVSIIISFLITLIYFIKKGGLLRPKFNHFSTISKSEWKKIFIFALPLLIEQFCFIAIYFAEVYFSNMEGVTGSGVYAVSSRFETIVYIFMLVLGSITTIAVSQFMGMKQHEGAKRTLKYTLRFCLILSVVLGIIFIGFPAMPFRLFTSDAAVIAAGAPIMRIYGICWLISPIRCILPGFLRSIGKAKFTLYSTVCGMAIEISLMVILLHFGVAPLLIVPIAVISFVTTKLIIDGIFVLLILRKWKKQGLLETPNRSLQG